jgi:membrane fusion protein (multidrug efflux system)
LIAVVVAVLVGGGWYLVKSWNVVSTDDAYVNGHVTYVAPRVAGQVARVFVDDNNRVHRGDILVQLDKEPFEVQLKIAQAAVDAANADMVSARAQARGLVGQTRSLRFALDHAKEEVTNQLALLGAKVAAWHSAQAELTKATADLKRAKPLTASGALAQEEIDLRTEARDVAEAKVKQALQDVYQVRVALGLEMNPGENKLAEGKPDLEETYSSVRQAQAAVIESASRLGYVDSFNKSPKQMVEDFYKQDPSHNIDVIYDKLIKNAPIVKQAEAKLEEANRNLDQAKLNLRYCDVVAEIDGVVTRREVNPGNNVIVGQNLMALRSLTDIWVDANFKETQLANLRIGQKVDLDVDMYGSRKRFEGKISGFTMGTGSTLALLPAENATGNFVKVVQRLPVRVDLVNYEPGNTPLFIGLSVTASVHTSGGGNGEVLQPYLAVPTTLPTTQPEMRR